MVYMGKKQKLDTGIQTKTFIEEEAGELISSPVCGQVLQRPIKPLLG